jgi:hypothetical protein
MTRRVFPLLVLAAALAAPAALVGSLRAAGNGKPAPKKLEVVVVGKTVTINGKKLSLPCERKALVEALGEPTREKELANRLLTWDELGVFAYQYRMESKKIHSLAMAFGKDDLEFWPKKAFTGTLMVYGAKVNGRTTLDAINKGATKPFKKGESLPDCYTVRDSEALLCLRESPPGNTEKRTFLEFSVSY